jgi:hypothetical protein
MTGAKQIYGRTQRELNPSGFKAETPNCQQLWAGVRQRRTRSPCCARAASGQAATPLTVSAASPRLGQLSWL